MIKKPIFDKKTIGLNPFLVPLKIPVYKLKAKHEYNIDSEGVLTPKEILLEQTPKVNIYVKTEHRLVVNSLNKNTKELFLWLIYSIETNEDYLWINKTRYMKELGITSINTYKSALKELIRYGIIQYTVITDVFWINPEFFFKGSRIETFPSNIIVT